jgi:hypothetical protein
MEENLLRPYREDGRYNVHLILDISMQNQAVNKSTKEIIDLPVDSLKPAFDRLQPSYVFIHDDLPDADIISPKNMSHNDWPNNKISHLVGIKWLEAYGIIEKYEIAQGMEFDYIILARADGLWLGKADTNQLPGIFVCI